MWFKTTSLITCQVTIATSYSDRSHAPLIKGRSLFKSSAYQLWQCPQALCHTVMTHRPQPQQTTGLKPSVDHFMLKLNKNTLAGKTFQEYHKGQMWTGLKQDESSRGKEWDMLRLCVRFTGVICIICCHVPSSLTYMEGFDPVPGAACVHRLYVTYQMKQRNKRGRRVNMHWRS